MVPASTDPLAIVAQMQEQLALLRQQLARCAVGSVSSRRLDHGSTADEYRVAHEALKDNDQIWPALSFAGLQHDDQGGLFELRHCPSCQSTITRPITASDALFLCELQSDLMTRSRHALVTACQARDSADAAEMGNYCNPEPLPE